MRVISLLGCGAVKLARVERENEENQAAHVEEFAYRPFPSHEVIKCILWHVTISSDQSSQDKRAKLHSPGRLFPYAGRMQPRVRPNENHPLLSVTQNPRHACAFSTNYHDHFRRQRACSNPRHPRVVGTPQVVKVQVQHFLRSLFSCA